MGADASRACSPARRRDRGSKGKRGRAEGDHPACTRGFQCDNGPHDFRAEGRGDRRGRSRIFRDFTLACARAEPLAREQNRGVCAAAKRRPAGSRETGLKRHPQEGQRSAASWRDPGPSASGERHVSLREGSTPSAATLPAARFTRAWSANADAPAKTIYTFRITSSRRRAVFFVSPARNDLQHVVRQWPLQHLRFIPRRAHPDVTLFFGRENYWHGLGVNGLHDRVRRGGQKAIDQMWSGDWFRLGAALTSKPARHPPRRACPDTRCMDQGSAEGFCQVADAPVG
jgi:hypothetical protein